jgi:hypothetical protein
LRRRPGRDLNHGHDKEDSGTWQEAQGRQLAVWELFRRWPIFGNIDRITDKLRTVKLGPRCLTQKANAMHDYLMRFSPGEMIAIVSVVGGLFVIMFAIGADVWHRARKLEIETKFKQELLDRGLSADEIKTVLDAGKNTSCSSFWDSIGRVASRSHANR